MDFCCYFIPASIFCRVPGEYILLAETFICCYDINAVALFKCLALSDVFSGVSGNALSVMVFTFPPTKFANDLTCFLY